MHIIWTSWFYPAYRTNHSAQPVGLPPQNALFTFPAFRPYWSSTLHKDNTDSEFLSMLFFHFLYPSKPYLKSEVSIKYNFPLPPEGFPGDSDDKESACNVGSIPGLRRFPGGGHGNPLQYSCLENPHGQRRLAGWSPLGLKESGMTELLSTTQQWTMKPEQIFVTASRFGEQEITLLFYSLYYNFRETVQSLDGGRK